MTRMLTTLVVLAGLVLAGVPQPAEAQPAAHEINVILPLTGPAAFLGTEESAALNLAQEVVNRAGGIKGRPIRFVVQDDGSVPQNSVQLLAGLVAKKAPIVIGSAIAATCSAMMPVVEKGPVVYCLSPIIQPANGSYAFTVAIAPKDFEPMMVRYARSRGWTRIGIITSIDATGQAMEKELDAALQGPDERAVRIVAREHFSNADISVAAQVARVKAQDPQVIFSFSAGTSFGTLLRGLKDGGLEQLPVFGAAGNMVHAQLEQYGALLPKELFFFTAGGTAPDPFANPRVRDAQRVYFDAFKTAGLRPGQASTVAWDSAMIVVEALRNLGADASSQQIRDYIEQVRGFAGVAGLYDFRAFEHRGLGPNATVAYRWDPARRDFVVVPQPAPR